MPPKPFGPLVHPPLGPSSIPRERSLDPCPVGSLEGGLCLEGEVQGCLCGFRLGWLKDFDLWVLSSWAFLAPLPVSCAGVASKERGRNSFWGLEESSLHVLLREYMDGGCLLCKALPPPRCRCHSPAAVHQVSSDPSSLREMGSLLCGKPVGGQASLFQRGEQGLHCWV